MGAPYEEAEAEAEQEAHSPLSVSLVNRREITQKIKKEKNKSTLIYSNAFMVILCCHGALVGGT